MRAKKTKMSENKCDLFYWKCEICGKYFISRALYYVMLDRNRHIKTCRGVLDQWLI